MDNCAIHHVPEVYKLFDDTGILVLFLPPYSPDMNPIEEAFSSVKYFLQDHDELLQAIGSVCVLLVQLIFNSLH